MSNRKTTGNKSTAGNTAGSQTNSRTAGNNNNNNNNNNSNNSGIKSSSEGGKITAEHKQTSFHKLFVSMLKDIYWAEKNLVDALGQMQQAATSDELKEAFEDHQHVTRKHVKRLEKVFSLLDEQPEAKKCDAMEGLIKEAKGMISETKEGSMTRDAALIIAAQKVEHYEIASYGSLVSVALTMGHDEVAEVLEKTLWEEEDTDKQLTSVAESYVNPMADEEFAGNKGEEEEEVEEKEMEEA